MKPTFFATPSRFRNWLEKNHEESRELWVGFYKTSSGKPSITWPEAVDEALCAGWIDGIRKSIDEASYTIRFTPRKPRSTWSAVNVKRAQELTLLGRMLPAGLRAFEKRTEEGSGIYSYEQRRMPQLDVAQQRKFRANPKALAFFEAQAPSYQRAAVWWVVSAKKEETRQRRLDRLIEDSAGARTIQPLTRPSSRVAARRP